MLNEEKNYLKDFQSKYEDYIITHSDLEYLLSNKDENGNICSECRELDILIKKSIENDLPKIENKLTGRMNKGSKYDLPYEKRIELISKDYIESQKHIYKYLTDKGIWEIINPKLSDLKSSVNAESLKDVLILRNAEVEIFKLKYLTLLEQKINNIEQELNIFKAQNENINFDNLDSEKLNHFFKLMNLKIKHNIEQCKIKKEDYEIDDDIWHEFSFNVETGNVEYIKNKKEKALNVLKNPAFSSIIIKNKEAIKLYKRYEDVYGSIMSEGSEEMDKCFSYMLGDYNNGRGSFVTYLVAYLNIRTKREFYSLERNDNFFKFSHKLQQSVKYVEGKDEYVSQIIFNKIMEELIKSLPPEDFIIKNNKDDQTFTIEISKNEYEKINTEYLNKNLYIINNIWSRACNSIDFSNENKVALNQDYLGNELCKQLQENREWFLQEKTNIMSISKENRNKKIKI